MIEQQQQILNSIMIANCNKYFSQHQQQIAPTVSQSSSSLVTKNSSDSLKIMSNPGATNSQATNGMSFSAGVIATAPDSPQPQATPAIANKMGSRRIFSPHFKIQVLESYRNDNDCKGNQRATARKYGIHRRQIQKWLQCETALRTSVSSASASSSPHGSSPSNSSSPSMDSNNNNHSSSSGTKRSLNGGAKSSETTPPTSYMLSTSSGQVQARHSVDESATHTQKNAMEFFSPLTATIINGGDGGKIVGSMNEAAAAAVPIKPEFCFTSSATTSPVPHPSAIVDMPSTAAMLRQHQHHHHQQQAAEEDAPHHSLLSAVPALPPFISTIYGPQSLLGFPCTFPFDYPAALARQPLASPIDLSVGNAERRSAGDLLFRRSPLIQVDDARVPTQNADERSSPAIAASATETAAPAAPIDLSCSRKRKSSSVAAAAEPVKPPKLFKPYLLDEQEDEEELKVVDDEDEATSAKEDSFLDTDLAALKDKLGPRFEYPAAVYPVHHQYFPGSSPAYDSQLGYSHENLTLYPSPRQYHSAESSPVHHPSRPASISSSDSAFGSYHPSSPASSVRSSPPVFSPAANWAPQEIRARIMGSAF